jgi:predicted ferric reductase
LKGDTSLKNTDIRMGVVALAAYTIMTFISVKPFLRKFAYEVFLISHILLVLYVSTPSFLLKLL